MDPSGQASQGPILDSLKNPFLQKQYGGTETELLLSEHSTVGALDEGRNEGKEVDGSIDGPPTGYSLI